MRVFDDMYHDVLHEQDRQRVWEELRRFIRQVFDQPTTLPSLLAADNHGYTYREYEQLSRKLTRSRYAVGTMRWRGWP